MSTLTQQTIHGRVRITGFDNGQYIFGVEGTRSVAARPHKDGSQEVTLGIDALHLCEMVQAVKDYEAEEVAKQEAAHEEYQRDEQALDMAKAVEKMLSGLTRAGAPS
jgi:hypothetical protein